MSTSTSADVSVDPADPVNPLDIDRLTADAAERLLPKGATSTRQRLLGTDVHVITAPSEQDTVPFVLLHHYFGNSFAWRHLIPLLTPTAPVIAMDRPGFGFSHRQSASSPGWIDHYSRGHAADLLAALLDHLGHERAVLVGCSAGGTATLEFVDRYPDRVAGFSLISPAVTGDIGPPSAIRALGRRGIGTGIAIKAIESRRGQVTKARIAGSWADPSRATDEDVAVYDLSTRGAHWADALWGRMVADDSPDLRHVFGRVTVPTTFMNGLEDGLIKSKWTKAAADATPNSTWVPLPGVGHTPYEEAPHVLVEPLQELHDRSTR